MMEENREGMGMKVIAVMVQRYGVLPRELWDLNRTSDMGAGRGIAYDDVNVSKAMFESIISNCRDSIISLTIGRLVAHKVVLPDGLRRLRILARIYEYPLDLPATLQELIFDVCCTYRQPVLLPEELRKLVLGDYYNQPLLLPSNLVELQLGSSYHHPLHLPQHLKRLEFVSGSEFNHPLALPDELGKLVLGYLFDQPLTLPPQLVELDLGSWYSHPLLLPQTMKRLLFEEGSPFNHPIALPQSLTAVYFGDSYDQPTNLPLEIEELAVGSAFTHDLSLPPTLRIIKWGCNRPIAIPEGVLEITFSGPFDQPVTFPTGLKKASVIGVHGSHPLNFPIGLTELDWYNNSESDDLVLPEGLQKLIWASPSSVRLPSGLRELYLYESVPLRLPEGLVKVTLDCAGNRFYKLPESVQEVLLMVRSEYIIFTHPTTLQHLILEWLNDFSDAEFDIDLAHIKIHKLTID